MSGLVSADALKYEIFRILHGASGPLLAKEIAAKIGVAAAAVTSCLQGDMLPQGDVSHDNRLRWKLRSIENPNQPHSAELEAQLNEAKAQIGDLRQELEKARWKLEQAGLAVKKKKTSRKVEALYLKVGLTADCEDHVFRAVRKSFRRRHHPDRKPDAEKKAAHVRFVELERIFEKLEKSRE